MIGRLDRDVGKILALLDELGIVRWPGRIEAVTVSDHISAFWDVLPTLVEIASGSAPAASDGISFLPELVGGPQTEHAYLYWEFHEQGGKQAVRMGRFKGVRTGLEEDPRAPIELYDLKSDPGETDDVAGTHPDIVEQIAGILANAREPSRDFPFPLDP